MESFRNSILESDSIMYQHLQSSIIFPLLPFLPWAMVPRIVIIWRSSQGSRAAFRAAGTEGAARGGSEGRPRFVLLILQTPSTNSSKYWVMLQGVTRKWKASCESAGVKTLQTRKGDVWQGRRLLPGVRRAGRWRAPSARRCHCAHWSFIFKHRTYLKLFGLVGLTFWTLGSWELWSYCKKSASPLCVLSVERMKNVFISMN